MSPDYRRARHFLVAARRVQRQSDLLLNRVVFDLKHLPSSTKLRVASIQYLAAAENCSW